MPRLSNLRSRTKKAGTSLIEVLVVIVVFLVGILAVAQVFPGGFKILANTNALAVANALGHDVGEQLRGHGQQLPDAILPVSNTDQVDATRFPTDLSIYDEQYDTLNADGSFLDSQSGNSYSNYAYYAGANVFRRIIGEGQVIPAPKTIGSNFGGLMVLQFGPTRQLSATETSAINVYGNDYEVSIATPPVGIQPTGQAYLSNAQGAGGQLAIYMDDPTVSPIFRITCSIYVVNGGNTYRRDIFAQQFSATNGPIGSINGNYFVLNLAALASGGDSYIGIDPSSIRVQRVFTPIASNATFSSTDPYQYKVLSLNYGVLLFSPLGYNYYIVRSSGLREPLRGRVDYETMDWRIVADQFRLQDSETEYKLSLNSLKVIGNTYEDGLAYKGLPVQAPLADGSLANTDVIFQDVQTGGIVVYNPTNPAGAANGSLNDVNVDPTKSSIYVNKSAGSFHVLDNNTGATGNQIMLALPDPSQPSGFDAPIVVNANNRTIRVLYMAKNAWTVQPLLAASVYYEVPFSAAAPPAAAEYMVGTTGTRIYFPNMDVGRKVSVDLAYYSDAGGNVHSMANQSFVVRNVPADKYPYIDLKEADSNAAALDFASHGFAIRGVHGISVTVRVLENPTVFNVTNGTTAFDAFTTSYRTATTDTFVERGSK